jgi:hypothetical protein
MARGLNKRLVKRQANIILELSQAASPSQNEELTDQMKIFCSAKPVFVVQVVKFTQLRSEHEMEL